MLLHTRSIPKKIASAHCTSTNTCAAVRRDLLKHMFLGSGRRYPPRIGLAFCILLWWCLMNGSGNYSTYLEITDQPDVFAPTQEQYFRPLPRAQSERALFRKSVGISKRNRVK